MGLCGSKLSAADMAFRKAAVDRETTILRGLNLTQEDGLILFKVSERKSSAWQMRHREAKRVSPGGPLPCGEL